MARTWQIQEAKSRFSEMVDEAIKSGPQIVSRRGMDVVVVLAYEEYKRMRKQEIPLGEFFRHSPLVGVDELDLTRDSSQPRPSVEL